MSQAHVERLIGKLITDETFRTRFSNDPRALLYEESMILTDQELICVLRIDPATMEKMSKFIDPRLVRCCSDST